MRPSIGIAHGANARNSPGGAFAPRAVLHLIFRRKWLIAVVFTACAVAVTLLVELLDKPRYEAAAQMLVAPAAVPLSTDGRSSGSPEERIARAVQLLTGRSLVEQVIDDIGVQRLYPELFERIRDRDALRMAAFVQLAKNLSVDANARSSIISLGFRHPDPELAASVPNQLGELYVDRLLLVERNPKVGAFLEEQLAARSRELAESERALEEFRSRHQIATSLTEERRLVAAELAALRTSLAETQTREGELKTQIQAMSAKAHQDAGIPRSYYQLRERLAALETEESELALRVTADHPRLREIREQLGGLRDRLRSSGIESAYGSAKEQEDFNVNLQTELTRVRSELEAATVRRFALSARVEEVRARLKSLEVIDGEFNRLQARVKSNEEAHRALQSRVEEARMASVRDEEKLVGIRMIEQAQPPAAPVDSRKEAKKALGILVSAFAAFGAAFALQWSRGRIETADEVERLLELPVLGAIVELPLK